MIRFTIDTDNAAFTNCGEEVSRILRDLADDMESKAAGDSPFTLGGFRAKLMDYNGNAVGEAKEVA